MKKKKLTLLLCLLLFIYFVGGIVYNFCFDKRVSVSSKNDSIGIKGYDYTSKDIDTELFKNEFKVLKAVLESDNIDYKEYAYSVSKLFIIDLYTLKNKKNMYDIGGVEFVYPSVRENYKLNVENTLYKYIEDYNEGKREQELPEVSKVEIVSDELIDYEIDGEKFEGYKVNVDITYVKDLEYDKEAQLILVKSDKYLYVVEKN